MPAQGAEPEGLRASLFRTVDTAEGLAALGAFLAEAQPERQLRQWFGARRLENADYRRQLARDIAEIDAALGRLLDTILHHPRLQRLEALWRSVHRLTLVADDERMARVKVLPCSWQELTDDLERAPEIEQCDLFNKLYNQEYGIAGGEPYGMLVIDHDVRVTSSGRDDVSILRELSHVAAAAFCPAVLGVDPACFGIDAFADLDLRADLLTPYRSPDYLRYRSLRGTHDARFLALAMPRTLARLPHVRGGCRMPPFPYSEEIVTAADLLWANAGFALAAVTLRSFVDYNWIAAIRGTVEDEVSAGVVEDLPTLRFETDRAPGYRRYPLDACVSDARERELNAMGVMALRPCYLTAHAAFYNVPSVYEPGDVRAGPSLETMLHFTLCASRFAHYIKVIARDWIGLYTTAAECEQRLQRWIHGYTSANSQASLEEKARYPLRHAQVSVTDVPGKPGAFQCSFAVQPHFQIEQMVSELRLKTTLEPTL